MPMQYESALASAYIRPDVFSRAQVAETEDSRYSLDVVRKQEFSRAGQGHFQNAPHITQGISHAGMPGRVTGHLRGVIWD